MSWQRGKPLAQDLRDRVLAATGLLVDVATRFGVSQFYVVPDRKPTNPSNGAGSHGFSSKCRFLSAPFFDHEGQSEVAIGDGGVQISPMLMRMQRGCAMGR